MAYTNQLEQDVHMSIMVHAIVFNVLFRRKGTMLTERLTERELKVSMFVCLYSVQICMYAQCVLYVVSCTSVMHTYACIVRTCVCTVCTCV